jgi:threonylcarbamoyladenosine tRNA methylthiotransferase MtaB
MKRGYTQEELSEKLNKLHLIYPLTFFGTDIITGFLEETDHDFQETYDFLNKSPIAKFHVFRFNKRDKTAAFYMSKKLKEPTPAQKAKRSQALIELSQKKYQKFLGEHLNQSFPALILKRKTKDLQEALLFNQIPVLVKAAEKDISQIKTVKILSQKYSTLMAEII